MSTSRPMFAMQGALPKLPVPPLAQSLERYLFYLKPLVPADQYAKTQQIVQEFGNSPVAQKLHAKLVASSQDPATDNWLERYWSDAYLKDRSSPGVYISPAVSISDHPDQSVMNDRCRRAALLIRYSVEFKEAIDNGKLPVDQVRGTPLCMDDYKLLFSSARVPLLGRDEMRNFDQEEKPSHVLVLCKGNCYALEVLSRETRAPLGHQQLYEALRRIESSAQSTGPGKDGSIPALTALHRDDWAKVRGHIISSHPTNHRTLRLCESALFVLCLDDATPKLDDVESCYQAMFGFPGKSAPTLPFCNRYWDKSLNVHVCANGRAGLTFEHSGMDSLPPLMWTKFVTERQQEEASKASSFFSAVSSSPAAAASSSDEESSIAALFEPISFRAMDDAIKKALRDGQAAMQKTFDAIDMTSLVVSDLGWRTLKPLKVSPDALAQMCYQVAYREVMGFTPSTYESATTKIFLHGRTETIRSASPQAAAFVDAFLNDKKSDPEVLAAFDAAMKQHGQTVKLASSGQGCDRHLYGLYCAAREEGLEPLPAIFTDPSYATYGKIELSTSHPNPVPGARLVCFGPVSERCIGIAYFLYEKELLFTFSSWMGKSAEFRAAFERALRRMVSILAAERPKQLAGAEAGKSKL